MPKDKIITQFITEQKKIYGTHFFLQQFPSGKIVVMTEKLAQKLRDQLDGSGVEVSSLDKDEGVGSFYRVKHRQKTAVLHYYRHPKEMDRLLHNLTDVKQMISFEKDEKGEIVMANELMGGELFRGFTPDGHAGYLVIAVDHDYEDQAPKVLGWLKEDENIEKVSGKEFFRPKKLKSFDEAIKKMIGLPYHLGGKSEETGYDCSSMIQKIFVDTKGIWLPRLAAWQFEIASEINESDLTLGDLVFFSELLSDKVSHVGIFIGENKIIHASPFHKRIIIETLSSELFKRGYKITSYGKF